MIDKIFMKRFIKSYETVYGHPPIVEGEANKYYTVQGLGKAHLKTLLQIAMFYNWCAKEKIKPNEVNDKVFNQLQIWFDEQKMNRLALALILNLNRNTLRDCLAAYNNNLIAAYNRCQIGALNVETVTWKEKTLTILEWAEELGMSRVAFNTRRRKHGDTCYLTFLSKEKYKKVSNTTKKRLVQEMVDNKKAHGNKEWQSLSSKRLCSGINGTELTFKQCNNLIAAMIHDAKVNLVKRHKTYFNQSQNFLMNSNGGLENLLESIEGLDAAVAIKELKYFAREGYKHCVIHQNTVMHRSAVGG